MTPTHPPKPEFDSEFVGMLAEFLDGARKMKAIYDAYIEAGFTPAHAIYLVGQSIRPDRGDA